MMKTYSFAGMERKIPAVALGTMRIPSRTQKEAEELLDAAGELGIDFIDTADIYGGGRSEEMLGQAFEDVPGLREKVILQSKAGIVMENGRTLRYDCSKEYLLSAVEVSLKRLKTDHLDFFLLHRPDALMNPEEAAEAFDVLHREGKVLHFGVSNQNPQQIRLLQKACTVPVAVNQLQFSILHSGMIDQGIFANMKDERAADRDGGILDFCMLNDILIQPWCPLQAGWEEGSFLNHPAHGKLNAVLEKLAGKYSVSRGTIAVAWILKHPAHMQPVMGTTSPVHLREAAEACNVMLTNQEWYDLYTAEDRQLP